MSILPSCCEWVFYRVLVITELVSSICTPQSKSGSDTLPSHILRCPTKMGRTRLRISFEQKVTVVIYGQVSTVELTSAPEKERLAPSRLGWSLWYTLAPSARNTTGHVSLTRRTFRPVLRIDFIPDTGSDFFSIPDPGSDFFSIPDPGSASKNLSILTPKNGF